MSGSDRFVVRAGTGSQTLGGMAHPGKFGPRMNVSKNQVVCAGCHFVGLAVRHRLLGLVFGRRAGLRGHSAVRDRTPEKRSAN